MNNSYPMNLTPITHVTPRTNKWGKKYLSFRAAAESTGHTQERTVRVFGEQVEQVMGRLKETKTIAARVSYDSFTGPDGKHSQTLRVVSLSS